MRILLVEDERRSPASLARALAGNTYAVDVAESGQKALELGADVFPQGPCNEAGDLPLVFD